MRSTLSVILPVHNVQDTLGDMALRLLELLPEVAERFDVLVMDDGSSDQTAEVAAELAQEFPQIRFVRHGNRRGMAAAIQTGIERSSGDFILVQDPRDPISPQGLRRLWELRQDRQLVVARIEPVRPAVEEGLISRLLTWGRAVQAATADRPLASGTQLISRQAVLALASDSGRGVQFKFARVDGAEKIAWTAGRARAGGVIGPIKDFALGE